MSIHVSGSDGRSLKFVMVQIKAIAQGAPVCNFVLVPTQNRLPWAIGQALVSSPVCVRSSYFA